MVYSTLLKSANQRFFPFLYLFPILCLFPMTQMTKVVSTSGIRKEIELSSVRSALLSPKTVMRMNKHSILSFHNTHGSETNFGEKEEEATKVLFSPTQTKKRDFTVENKKLVSLFTINSTRDSATHH